MYDQKKLETTQKFISGQTGNEMVVRGNRTRHPKICLVSVRTVFSWLLLENSRGTSLVVQWLRLQAPKAGGPGYIAGQRIRS